MSKSQNSPRSVDSQYPLPLHPELKLIMKDLETLATTTPNAPSPAIGTSHGGLCVVDWCVQTTAVSPKDLVVEIIMHTNTMQ